MGTQLAALFAADCVMIYTQPMYKTVSGDLEAFNLHPNISPIKKC